MSREIGPLPLIETGAQTLVALLPGELEGAARRAGRVSRDRDGLRVAVPGATGFSWAWRPAGIAGADARSATRRDRRRGRSRMMVFISRSGCGKEFGGGLTGWNGPVGRFLATRGGFRFRFRIHAAESATRLTGGCQPSVRVL